MANQRRKDKILIGAHVSNKIAAGIELWLDQHPGKTRTDFLIEASVEKLKDYGIFVPPSATVDKSRRDALPDSAFDGVRSYPAHRPASVELNEKKKG